MAYENRSMSVKVPGIIAMILPPIFVIARLWIRLAITKLFGIDDWMILASMVRSPSTSKYFNLDLHAMKTWIYQE